MSSRDGRPPLRPSWEAGSETSTPVPDRYAGLDLVVEKIATFGGRLEELAATGVVAAFGLEPVEDAERGRA